MYTVLLTGLLLPFAAPAAGQSSASGQPRAGAAEAPSTTGAGVSEAPPAEALRPELRGRRVVVAVDRRMLWLVEDQRILFSARVAVGKPVRMEYDGRVWDFNTPRGRHVIQSKELNPVWVPPDWHYVELAALQGWKLVKLNRSSPTRLADGRRLIVRGNRIFITAPGREEALPPGGEIVINDTLFVPPFGTVNRRIPGALGGYRLNLGDGYAIHGAPTSDSIGGAETHGCIRLDHADLANIFANVSVGTRVYVY